MNRFLVLSCLVAITASPGFSQGGDAEYGKAMLTGRRCTACHAVEGEGGGSAPDLSRRREEQYSPDELAAEMWNHAPRMWQAMEARQMPLVALTESDISNVYAYFYSRRYFDPAGGKDNGKKIFRDRQCAGCHDLGSGPKSGLGEDGSAGGPPVGKWSTMADPVLWLQSMWNHGAEMSAQMKTSGVAWPTFTLQEMVDLLEFIENEPEHQGLMPYMRLGDWRGGEELFSSACAQCHVLGGGAAGDKVDLLEDARRQPLLSGLAVEMWNHRPQMEAAAAARNVELTSFEADQMADVTAYLFRRGYFQVQGDAARGGKAYESMGCASCHDSGQANAPALSGKAVPFSALQAAAAVWQHGPNMKVQMDYLDKAWPELTAENIADLVAFVNSR